MKIIITETQLGLIVENKATIMKFLNENQNLTYDQLDLDVFTNRYIVGRWFGSEDEAKEYLISVINKSDEKNAEDFIILKNNKDTSLKPYRIYPKPSDIEIKRNEASNFIKKYGILSSANLNYVTYPLYAYVKYKHIDKIKELGVLYNFKPIEQINLNGVLSRFLKENGHTNTISSSDYNNEPIQLKLYNYNVFNIDDEYNMTLNDIKSIKKEIEKILNNFNNFLGTDYYISKTIKKETDESKKQRLLNKLDDKKYNPAISFDKKYKEVLFILNRGNDEGEFLAIIKMDDIDKPKMIGNF